MTKPRAIVTDLDGTLLREDKTVSERTLQTLWRCREAGMRLVVATARSEAAANRVLSVLRPDGVIANGGAKILLQGKVLDRQMLSASAVCEIAKKCLSLSNGQAKITVQTDEGYFWNYKEMPPVDSDYANAIWHDFHTFPYAAYKVTAEVDDEEAAAAIAAGIPDCQMTPFREEKWKRFAKKGATKAHGVRVLSKALGIFPEEMIAFGDDANDVDLLRAVGKGVAMKNAIPALLAVADAVTPASNEEDGVARFLEELLS